MGADIKQVRKDLFLIKLNLPIDGFKNFIGCWVFKEQDNNILIDVGPTITARQLLEALKKIKIYNINYILLTHLHLDHAGAIAIIVNYFKNVEIICHHRGIPHLINPNKLFKGSIKILKNIADLYNSPMPIRINKKLKNNFINNKNFLTIKTPGHSPHHISIVIKNYLFLGEACGFLIKKSSNQIYMRPSTPPKFYLEKYIKSISKLKKLNIEILCYGHLEAVKNKKQTINLHQIQMNLWINIIKKCILDYPKKNKKLLSICTKQLIINDNYLKPLLYMNKATQKRELFFIKNSIKGIIGNFLRKKKI